MIERRLAPLLALLACAPAAAAQLQFDYIYYDKILRDDGSPSAFFGKEGILVNTGTVPFDVLNDWTKDGLMFGQVHGPLDPSKVFMNPNISPTTVLLPGEAIGSPNPLLTALLAPGESFTPGDQTLTLQFGASPPNSTSTLELCILAGGRKVHFEIEIQIGDGSSGTNDVLSAQRYSSVPATAAFEQVASGCPLPLSPLDLHPSVGGGGTAQGIVSNISNMPVVGNSAFRVACTGIFDMEIGAPWIFAMSPSAASLDLGAGCTLHLDPTAPGFFVETGTIILLGDPYYPEYQTPSIPFLALPIPNNAAFAGATFRTQCGLVTTNAPNGFLALSNAYEITVGTCP